MKIIIKNFKTNSLISGIAFTLLGLLLAIFPTAASQFVGYILGAVLVVLGVISLVRYFSTLSMFVWYQGDFLLGLFETLFGLFIFLNPGIVMASIPFFFGLILFVHGLIAIGPAIELKQIYPGSSRWIFSLVLALISVLLGFIIFSNPFGTVDVTLRIVGACLIYSGISDFITYIRGRRADKTVKRNPDGSIDGYVDADFSDVK